MRTIRFCFWAGILIFAATIFHRTARGQGNLTPLGGPAPTMKSLDQIEARAPISSLPYTITNSGSYYLTGTLTGVSGSNGVVIVTNNVSLDLNGFALIGATNSGTGIYIQGTFYNVSVRNGSVFGWGGDGVDGYNVGFSRNVIFESLTVASNKGSGILTEATSVVRNCLSYNNGNHGFYSAGGLIVDSVARGNAVDGFDVFGSKLRSCISHFNVLGINADHSTIEDCDISDNSGNGVQLFRACQLINNRISDHLNASTGYAIWITGERNSVIGNTVVNNTFGLIANGAGVTNNCIVQNRFIASGGTSVLIPNMFPTAETAVSSGFNFGSTNSLVNILYP